MKVINILTNIQILILILSKITLMTFCSLWKMDSILYLPRKQSKFTILNFRPLPLLKEQKMKISAPLMEEELKVKPKNSGAMTERHTLAPMAPQQTQNTTRTLKRVPIIRDITKLVEVDVSFINYNSFLPGKMLGSTFTVKNISNSDQIVDVSVDSTTPYYDGQTLENIMANVSGGKKSVVNSEVTRNCWFIENPMNKELAKNLKLKLGPNCEMEFICVVKAPMSKTNESLCSFINLKFPKKQNIDDKSYLEVLLFGKIEPPSLECPKQITNSICQIPTIPIALKKNQACQKFRFPFKNNGSLDHEFEFTFVKSSDDSTGSSMSDMFDFFCMPGTLKIEAETTGVMNVLVKHSGRITIEQLKQKAMLKLLVGKVKDTSMMFSFYVDVKLID